MTLEQATNAVLMAIDAEDLTALAHALDAREAALRDTAKPSQEAQAAGEAACLALAALKQRWAAEEARLHQMQSAFAAAAEVEPTHIALHG